MKRKFRDVLGSMTFKEKVDYIWGYYKIHIIAGIFFLMMTGYTVHAIAGGTETYLNVTFVGQSIHEGNLAAVREQINENLIHEDKQNRQEVVVQNIIYENRSGDDISATERRQQLIVWAATGMLDILITEEDIFQELQAQEFFLPLNYLDGFHTLCLNEEDSIQGENTNNIYGIRLNDIEIFDNTVGGDERILAVSINSERHEEVMEFLQFIFSS